MACHIHIWEYDAIHVAFDLALLILSNLIDTVTEIPNQYVCDSTVNGDRLDTVSCFERVKRRRNLLQATYLSDISTSLQLVWYKCKPKYVGFGSINSLLFS